MSVPSTLVKCLYLFFDLPEIENPDSAENGSEFTPRERRILLQKIFVQVSLTDVFFLYILCPFICSVFDSCHMKQTKFERIRTQKL